MAPTVHANASNTPAFVVDAGTGFLESTLHKEMDLFDATKKLAFIEALRANDFRFAVTCQQTGVSPHTVYKHRRNDKAFDEAIRQSIDEYADNLEWMSRSQAMEPKATLERIFQLRALRPERYARDLKDSGGQKIEISITGDLITFQKKHADVLETSVVREVESAIDSPSMTITHNAPISDGLSTVSNSMGEESRGERPRT